MNLKRIPLERSEEHEEQNIRGKRKAFNPSRSVSESPLKTICLKLVRYINKGGRYTTQQIDELIMGLQRSIINLQKKKHELSEKKRKK